MNDVAKLQKNYVRDKFFFRQKECFFICHYYSMTYEKILKNSF